MVFSISNPLIYSFGGLKSDKMENPTACIVIRTKMSKLRTRLKLLTKKENVQ